MKKWIGEIKCILYNNLGLGKMSINVGDALIDTTLCYIGLPPTMYLIPIEQRGKRCVILDESIAETN